MANFIVNSFSRRLQDIHGHDFGVKNFISSLSLGLCWDGSGIWESEHMCAEMTE